MLGDIDYNKKPITPQFFLCKPDRTIIGKLTEAFNASQNSVFNSVNEMTLSVPYSIDLNHILIENDNILTMQGLYKIKVVKGKKVEWYIITDIQDDSSDSSEYRTLSCKSLQYELNKKLITVYEQVSYNATQVFDDILENTNWNYDYVDADFRTKYREFNFTDQTVLDCIFNVAETYNAIITFNTDARTFSMFKPELFGVEDGTTFSTAKYLKSMNKTTDFDDIVTQLIVRLSDGLGIETVNPTGQEYIADYSYFIFPFQRDANRNVIQHSHYLSDSLCHALLDYQALVEANSTVFKNALSDLNKAKEKLPPLEVERDKYLIQRKVIGELYNTLMVGLSVGEIAGMYREMYSISGNFSKIYKLRPNYYYAILCQPVSGITLRINGNIANTSSTEWTVNKIGKLSEVTISITGNANDFYYNIVPLDMDEHSSSGNDKEILYKYETLYIDSLRKKVNTQIKEIEISVTNFQNTVKYLQNLLSTNNNFTQAQLTELVDFNNTEVFENNDIIDPQFGYDEAMKKFKELQIPRIEFSMDIVNFLENIESQADWDKIVLGNYVVVRHEPSGTDLLAQITEINYNYADKSISLTLSNVKNRNDSFAKMQQLLYDAKGTSVIVNRDKSLWNTASKTATYINNLFDNFWNKVTNEINMAVNETVQIDSRGITITDPNDPLRFLRATHGVLGLTRSGGLRYETAISADGIIAEMILGKVLTSQRVEIGDDDGYMLIKGATINIKDKCMREVVLVGQLSESSFGMKINRYSSNDCANTTILNRVSITGEEGLVIERNRNGTFEKTLYNSVDGDLYMKGNLQVGDGQRVFIANSQGISVGSSSYNNAPFRVDMFGNAYMNRLFAESAIIKDSSFLDGLIQGGDMVGTSITLGEAPDVIKLFPLIGFWAGAENFEDAPASIAMDGTAKFKNATFTNGDGVLLINTETKQIEMNNFDIVGAGAIDTDLLSAQIITADDGFITDLTANRISTLSSANVGAFSNYIKAEGQNVKWVTGKASGSGTPRLLPDGRPLYWVDVSQTGRMTIEETSYPVLVYTMEEKVKMLWSFEGEGDSAIPYVAMGIGDGTEKGGKFIIRKPNGSVDMRYYASNTQKERAIALLDNGLNVYSDGGEINIRNGEVGILTISADGKITIKGKTLDYDLTG